MPSLTRAVRKANPVMTSVFALSAAWLLTAEPAKAGCSLDAGGTSITCTATVLPVIDYNTATGVDTLNVHDLLNGPSFIRLWGEGEAVGNAPDSKNFTCLPAGNCTIVTGADGVQDCTALTDSGGHPIGTCIPGIPETGPSGRRGPNVTVNIAAPVSGSLVLGSLPSLFTVVGESHGSQGGNGGDRYGAGDAGDGGVGLDGGTVVVNFEGVITSQLHGGIVAGSFGGQGGDGGDAKGLWGDDGDGGAGGFGGHATVHFLGGSIATTGEGNVGITAISQGGGGGSAGHGGGLVHSGGDGSDAGKAGEADVFTVSGTVITTTGDSAHGISATSLGGGGGDGSGGFGLFYSGGGNGASGGNGGTVIVDVNSTISTSGDYAYGIIAQSVGGGGGSAGRTTGTVALGGNGEGGGSGGSVTLNNTGEITTSGTGATGIKAQSIGGGGGNGANSGGFVSLGGDGSGTTVGGDVVVRNAGAISTSRSDAAAIFAQSVGGGGGDGGSTIGAFSYGGDGGDGADGGIVRVINSGDIITGIVANSSTSPGIIAQSIGGGGGNGGGAIAANPSGFAAAFGGRGGMAGDGKNVYVSLDDTNVAAATAYTVETYGDASSAIVAQSIGGGGGNGGFAVTASAGNAFSVAFGTGGSGGAGGDAGRVEATAKGSLLTLGDASSGIMAQSIGGGGGNGGFSVSAGVSLGASVAIALGGTGAAGGDASNVLATSYSDITTAGTNAYGILAQSIGGGGGNGGFSSAASGGIAGFSVGVGGSGGAGGDAGTVHVYNHSEIFTFGGNAAAIAAQSIGGGGGNGGFSAGGAIGAIGIGVSVGGSGATGGLSSTALADSSGLVTTVGDNSIGILAQSIGGGGGNGGFAASAAISLGGSASVGVGGSGGSGQDAGAAFVYADAGSADGAGLTTWGDNSAGVVAQSIGGGGGNGGMAGTLSVAAGNTVGLSLGGKGGVGGAASTATVRNGYGRDFANDIQTFGKNSSGIVAQSIGGGGGNGGFAVSLTGSIQGGSSAAITVGGNAGAGSISGVADARNAGDITTWGDLSNGIIVQSIGGSGGNGGFAVSLSAATAGYTGAVSVGGNGGSGNHAASAIIDSTGAIVTKGDQAVGLIAQSIGGGGGNGGFAGSGSLSFSSVGVAVGLGGSGSGGGNGSIVTLTNDGDITTFGKQSSAIIAQSIGGGGGNGGSTVGLSIGGLGGASVVIGGSGGAGGDADKVVVNSTGDLVTGAGALTHLEDSQAYGILAQSLGGGGGNGGFAGSLSAGGAVGIGVSVGGSGSGGGDAGDVEVTNDGDIRTDFANSGGILAQSIGGGGGNGGFSVALSASASIEDIGAAAAVSVGGFGDVGGKSANVSVTSTGTVATRRVNSDGIAAQSIGGGGGNGGFAVAGAATLGNVGVDVAVGGFGAGGGDGAQATLISYGAGFEITPDLDTITIETRGALSNGILAQSLGGGGGNGGFSVGASLTADGAAIGVTVGGFGAGGGDSDIVTMTSYNNIRTLGYESNAIAAQSIGGGGGNGGWSASVAAGSEFSGAIAVGGSALGGGGDSESVTLESYGRLSTKGDKSNGILAQSIGGGGGNGGFALSGSLSMGSAGMNASVGGFGDEGGNSAAVIVTSFGSESGIIAPDVTTIETLGDMSNGILAQSIGGGGGNGGFAAGLSAAPSGAAIGVSVGGFGAGGGEASTVNVTSWNNIYTDGFQSNAIAAQSIGGGGGNGGFSLQAAAGSEFGGAVSVGGSALGGGGNSDDVMVANIGALRTLGLSSNGILAQSIGGSGGNGGFALSGEFSAGSAGLNASVGGFGSTGGDAGTVGVIAFGFADSTAVLDYITIETTEEFSNGILAQSIGGGGGNGGFSAGAGLTPDGAAFGVSVGGFGAGGGNADDVMVMSRNNIVTAGYQSTGLSAQSLGGGGGNGGFSMQATAGSDFAGSVAVGGFGAGGGDAGDVAVGSTGMFQTAGDEAHGILAQSIGGGGGNGGFALAGSFTTGDAGLTATIGGFGAGGGLGGDVIVASNIGTTLSGNSATIYTTGESANGIEAQSIGGGGGNGGFAGGFTATADAKLTMTLSVGGFGAAGNSAGSVDLSSVDNILTEGNGANGIIAQSVGGGGGNGGFSFAGSLSVPDGKSLALAASLGGFGGSGGDSDIVSLDSTGLITTFGDEASGVVAQSVGGGGGNGGISVAGTFSFATENTSPSIAASVGGFGGSGGAGDDVFVTRTGVIRTWGEKSAGIMAQSVGGGGGNGGLSIAGSLAGPDAKQITASVGGFGGAGSEAGNVTVENTGAITTGKIESKSIQIAEPGLVFKTVDVEYGYAAHGILAQSIGGGGGNGGFSFSGSVGPTGENTSLQVGVTVGGFGGSGGYAGDVDVTNTGLITTYGAASFGIAAQSVGGGGGNGGGALTGMMAGGDPQSGGRSIQVAVSVGGMGGDGNVAGAVSVDQRGGIRTFGDQSYGILAQSVGGGGGNGGGANTLALQLATSCTFTLPGMPQIGNCQDPKARSVNAQVDVGGFGGTGNDGGIVTVTNHDVITTYGSAAAAILAQSIGGGGGNGGQAIVGLGEMFQGATYLDIGTTIATLPIGLTGVLTGFGKVTVGGFGGSGGDGEAVTITNEGVITTSGDTAYGIAAQSVGAGGGNGGNATSGVTGAVSVGGFGAASGEGGAVTVTNVHAADITTTGYWSIAILAQSIGGGGGNGGAAGAIVALGGFGGASGSGGAVDVVNAANLRTTGVYASGIVAQSIGGGGGNGGGTGLSGVAVGGEAGVLGATGDGGTVTVRNANNATILTTGSFANGIFAQSVGGSGGNGGGSTVAAAITIGGIGGNSGDGGLVQIFNDGLIETRGATAHGIFAQSVGGSGGNGGGSNIAAINVGGFGGGSGDGGEVDIVNTNQVVAQGSGSDAIRAQSIGGGGGSAGGVGQSITSGGLSIGVLIDVGGYGGAAGDGGTVNVTNSGLVVTTGNASAGIRAQSVGGGGGTGGDAIGIVALGGKGGASGRGGDVAVMNNTGGDIWTTGMLSHGIFAQSVGGGGGSAGGAWGAWTDPVSGFGLTVGGDGGSAANGDGGAVSVGNRALIHTDGLMAHAIFAQSVGGGGGNGGTAGTFNGTTTPVFPPVTVNVGGNGGTGGDGGTVAVINHADGTIISNGAFSTAVFAQSVGGGGGSGGYAMINTVVLSGSAGVQVGGKGGSAGNGGEVDVRNDGRIVINGKNSIGIMAQSVGGGGGSVSAALGTSEVPVTLGGETGANGTGGNVSVTNAGSIVINGNNSVGIFAQSVGGGGGVVLPGGGVSSVTTQSGGTGDGGTVTIDNTAGSIVINGENSIAMYTQSVGGGGGAVGLDADPPGQIGAFLFSGNAGGTGEALATTINQAGNLIATGVNSIALVAQSTAIDGTGDITVNILNPAGGHSLILGGLGQGAGVEFLDGDVNTLNNAGVIAATPVTTFAITGYSADDGNIAVIWGSALTGTSGYAVRAYGGTSNTIDNTGVIMGSVDLGAGPLNAFFNRAGAYFDAGAVVMMGAGSLTNAGILSPGAFNRLGTTSITGNLSQTSTGLTGIDLDLRGDTADQIAVSGSAVLAGVVRTNFVDPLVAPGYALPGAHAKVILTAAGGVSHPGLTLQTFNTAVAHYGLAYPTAQRIELQYQIDYAPAGMTANQTAMGALVNTVQTAQTSPGFRPIAVNLFYLPDVPTLAAAYDSLSGEGVAAVTETAFDANERHMGTVGTEIRSWMTDSPRDSAHAWHLWLQPYGGGANYGGDPATGSAKVTTTAYGISGGFDYQVSENLLLGFAAGGGTSWFKVPDRATRGSVDSEHFGLYGAWNEKDYYVSGMVSYDAFQNMETRRATIPGVVLPRPLFVDGPFTVPGFDETPRAIFHGTALSGHVETGYRIDLDPVQIMPFAAMEFGALHNDAVTEMNNTVPSVIGIAFPRHSASTLPSLLGIMFDAKTDVGGFDLTSWVKATWKHEFDTDRIVSGALIAAPEFAFNLHGAEPSADTALADIGVKLTLDESVAIFAGFTGEAGGRTTSYAGTVGVSLRW